MAKESTVPAEYFSRVLAVTGTNKNPSSDAFLLNVFIQSYFLPFKHSTLYLYS